MTTTYELEDHGHGLYLVWLDPDSERRVLVIGRDYLKLAGYDYRVTTLEEALAAWKWAGSQLGLPLEAQAENGSWLGRAA
jgi:hypothetical protein